LRWEPRNTNTRPRGNTPPKSSRSQAILREAFLNSLRRQGDGGWGERRGFSSDSVDMVCAHEVCFAGRTRSGLRRAQNHWPSPLNRSITNSLSVRILDRGIFWFSRSLAGHSFCVRALNQGGNSLAVLFSLPSGYPSFHNVVCRVHPGERDYLFPRSLLESLASLSSLTSRYAHTAITLLSKLKSLIDVYSCLEGIVRRV